MRLRNVLGCRPSAVAAPRGTFDPPRRRAQDSFDVQTLEIVEPSGRGRRGFDVLADKRLDQIQDTVGARDDGAFDHMLELSDVAGPVVRLELLQDARRNGVDALVIATRELGDEVVHEQGHIGQPRAAEAM
jgi:hypothetical protein